MLQIFCTLSACVCALFVPPHQVASNFSNYLFWLPWSCCDSLHHRVHTQREHDANFFYKTPRRRNWLDIRNSWAVPAAVTSLQVFLFYPEPRATGSFLWKMKQRSFNAYEIHFMITYLTCTQKDGVSSAKCHFESAGNRECPGRAKVQLQMLFHISGALSELNCSPESWMITVMWCVSGVVSFFCCRSFTAAPSVVAEQTRDGREQSVSPGFTCKYRSQRMWWYFGRFNFGRIHCHH